MLSAFRKIIAYHLHVKLYCNLSFQEGELLQNSIYTPFNISVFTKFKNLIHLHLPK